MALVVAMISNLLGKPIRRIVVSDEEYRRQLVDQGPPEARIAISFGLFQASRRGEFAKTSTALADLIGGSPV